MQEFWEDDVTYVSLEHKIISHAYDTVISSTGIFVEIAKITLYGSKLLIFLLCKKIIRILRSCSMKILLP